MNHNMLASLLIALASISAVRLSAQQNPNDRQPDSTLTPQMRSEVIDGILKVLEKSYVFPDTAKRMDEAIRARLTKKEYDQITSAKDFARRLTGHLQEVSHDKHLRVQFSHEKLPKMHDRKPTAADRDRMRQFAGKRNFGFEKVERLAGNVGLIEVRGFMPADLAGETAASAMNFLAHCDALIIDLRKNGGGSPADVALLCSYLFPAEPVVHLNDLYYRPDNSTHQWWTLPFVPGQRFVEKPVYVLTSKRTFSAAEECTYNLQNQKRATIVGETTGGGAHPGGPQPVNDHFAVWVPTGRAINPISKTNWEGTGVKPDIETTATLALKTAHLEALQKISEKHKGDADDVRELREVIDSIRKELDEVKDKSPGHSISKS